MYINVSVIKLNTTIGLGLFYLKGYYEDGHILVTEQGIGVITLPLAIGLIASILIKGAQFYHASSVMN